MCVPLHSTRPRGRRQRHVTLHNTRQRGGITSHAYSARQEKESRTSAQHTSWEASRYSAQHMSRRGVTLLCTAHAKRRSHVTLHNICQMEASRTVSLHNTHHEKESRHYINGRQGESSRHYINTSTAASGHYISIQQGKSSRHYINRRQRHDTTIIDSKGSYHETTVTHIKGNRHDCTLSTLIDYHYCSVTTLGLIHGKADRHDTTLAHSKGSHHDIRLIHDKAGRHDYINTRQRQVVTKH